MQVYLAVAPEHLASASRFTRALSHAAYRIGPESVLLRQSLLLSTCGGLLCVSDRAAPTVDAPEKLASAILRECVRRDYVGAVLDWDEKPREDLLPAARAIGEKLSAHRLALYVPETYAAASGGNVLVCTALSGGNLAQRLREAAARYPGRLALDLERLAMDFPLPCPSGVGTSLTRETLSSLMARESPAVFFSPELCARYFTYSHSGETHFVLFDDGDTLLQKLRLGGSLGASAAFFQYPEVSDLLPRLFGRKS